MSFFPEVALLIAQCLLTFITSYTAIFQLRKELRRSSSVAQSEAKQIYIQLILIGSITIIVQLVSSFISIKDQDILELKYKNLEKQYSNLKDGIENTQKNISSKIDSTEGQIALQASVNALKASNELKISTKWLSEYVNGSDQPPKFYALDFSNPTKFVLENTDSLKANIDAFIVNYDESFLCKRLNGLVDRVCFFKSLAPINWNYILAGKQVYIELPRYDPSRYKSKFFIKVTLARASYIIEVLIQKINFNTTLFTSRTLKKINNKYIVYKVEKSSIKIEWEKEFTIPYNEVFADL